MKRLSVFICALLILLTAGLAASAEETVYAGGLKDGTYKIEVESSSSMFRIIDCELTVSDGEMTALMTLSGTGYEKLFMGNGEEAAAAPESKFIYFKENDQGKYTYAVPVSALGTGIPCAAFSTRKQRWYDRTLVFRADSLPADARKNGITPAIIVGIVIGAALAAALIALVLKAEKKKKENERN